MQFKAQKFNYKEYVLDCARIGGLKKMSIAERQMNSIGARWTHFRRPFFNVYPGVEKCLRNTRLGIDPGTIPQSVLHDLQVMEVRFAASSDVDSFFLSITDCRNPKTGAEGTAMFTHRYNDDGTIYASSCSFGNFVDLVKTPEEIHGLDNPDFDDLDAFNLRMRFAIGVMMLASDPRFCQPVLLNRDRDKVMTDEQRDVAIERARNRNNYGFDIGRDIEVSPHFRRPHFAIRWTGKGANVPRLVPVKGAIINEKLVTQIPSGFEG